MPPSDTLTAPATPTDSALFCAVSELAPVPVMVMLELLILVLALLSIEFQMTEP